MLMSTPVPDEIACEGLSGDVLIQLAADAEARGQRLAAARFVRMAYLSFDASLGHDASVIQ